MALSGLDIYKLLPKTNCKECGFPTCLAFAMKLAQKGAELSACPYVTEEAKAALDAASRPPIRLITVGSDGKKFSVGNEVVMFRHEKTFFNPPGLMIRVKDTDSADALKATVTEASTYTVERVGQPLTIGGFAVQNASGDAAKFAQCVEAVRAITDMPLALLSTDPAAMEAGLAKAGAGSPLIYAATKDNYEKMAELALKYKAPLAIYEASSLDALAELSQAVAAKGVQDMVLDPGKRGLGETLSTFTQLRRLALKKLFRPFGYPVIAFPGEGAASLEDETILAGVAVSKYGGIVVLDRFDPSEAYSLLTLRQNIYTDPQKPIQMQPGIYKIGEPNDKSPLYVSTNFSLTYFSVAGEIEGSGIPSWLLICDSEGLSVLTAWAAGKFDAEKIAKTIKSSGIADKVGHHKVIIPGHVAVLSGELEEELPDWTIMVGTKEAVDIPGYIKRVWTA